MTIKFAPRRSGTEERILVAAAGLFARFGYNGISTREIASAAGVNEVTIYRYYSCKRDLYLAALDSELRQVSLRDDLLARVAEAQDGQKVLVRTFELIDATLRDRPEFVRLLQYSALELNEDIDPLLRRHLGELIEVISSYLEPWVNNGQLHCASAKLLTLTLISIVLSRTVLHRVLSGCVPELEAMFSAYAELCAALT
jgi:AcrR family transcriptional regulator